MLLDYFLGDINASFFGLTLFSISIALSYDPFIILDFVIV